MIRETKNPILLINPLLEKVEQKNPKKIFIKKKFD